MTCGWSVVCWVVYVVGIRDGDVAVVVVVRNGRWFWARLDVVVKLSSLSLVSVLNRVVRGIGGVSLSCGCC